MPHSHQLRLLRPLAPTAGSDRHRSYRRPRRRRRSSSRVAHRWDVAKWRNAEEAEDDRLWGTVPVGNARCLFRKGGMGLVCSGVCGICGARQDARRQFDRPGARATVGLLCVFAALLPFHDVAGGVVVPVLVALAGARKGGISRQRNGPNTRTGGWRCSRTWWRG